MLDGVFAFVLLDKKKGKVIVARDCYGVRPLFEMSNGSMFVFSSEMKTMVGLNMLFNKRITQFPPGTISSYSINNGYWSLDYKNRSFCSINTHINPCINDVVKARVAIRKSLVNAVEKRVKNTDRKIACLLSGGLDSSLITALVSRLVPKGELETYSIGMKGSEDLQYAQKVADYLGTKHTQIELTEAEFLKAIPEVIYAIESYDTTTVRASVGNYLVAQYISNHSDAKVIFNGDGSDEVCGGYLYFHYSPDCIEFDIECNRLLKDIHYFDVLRSDRSISSAGLEARTPFLDRNFVQTYLSIPPHIRCHKTNMQNEKYLLRSAFADMKILPNEVLFRKKEAFSDGVSTSKRPWYETIQNDLKSSEEKKALIEAPFMFLTTHNEPKTGEQIYYRKLFQQYYGEHDNVIPYFWMPKFINATDCSARTLSVYK